MYSPVVDCASEIGRNAAAVVSDEINNGTRNSRAEPTAASTGRRPAAICTMIDSAITMALSTSMPSAMIQGGQRHLVEPDVEKAIASSDAIIAIGTRLATTSTRGSSRCGRVRAPGLGESGAISQHGPS